MGSLQMATRHCCPQQQAAAAGMLQQRPRCSWRRPRAGTALTPCHTSAPRRVPWLSAPPAHSRAAVAALQFAFQRRRQLCRNPGAAPPAALNINACPTLRGGTCRGRPSAPGSPPGPHWPGSCPGPPRGCARRCGGAVVVPAVPLTRAGRNKARAGGRWGQRGTESSQESSQPPPLPPRPGGHRRLCRPPPLLCHS